MKTKTTNEGPPNWRGAGMGRIGTGKYESIRQDILKLKPGEEWLKVECEDRGVARSLQVSLSSGRVRPSNSLHEVSIATRLIGTTLWVTRLTEETP